MLSSITGVSNLVLHSLWVSRSINHSLRSTLSHNTTYFELIIKTSARQQCLVFIMSSFHYLPKQNFSVAVRMEKNHNSLSNVVFALLSSLLLYQKHKCVVESSVHIANSCAILFEADRNRLLLKHK